jgi:integrase
MPRAKLTRQTVTGSEKKDRPYIVYDTDLKGFGLKVMPSGTKTWIIEYRPGAGGRGVAPKRVTLGRADLLTPDEARGQARDLLAKARLGDDVAANRKKERQTPTLAELVPDYLKNEVLPTVAASTHTLYSLHFRKHLLPAFGTRKINAISEDDVHRFHRELGAKKPATANRVVATLSGIFPWAARAKHVPRGFNPCAGLEKFREEGRERYLTTEELQRLGATLRLAETEGLPWAVDMTKPKAKHNRKPEKQRVVTSQFVTAAIRLLLFTGCRLREVLHLEWSHVDFERGMLFLPKSKTGKKVVILNAPALAVLASLPRAGDFVIASTDPKKPRADLKKPWDSITEHAGLTELRIHDLRHSFASVGAGGGIGLPIIGKLLGQTQQATTARYAHLDADPVKRASEKIAGTIAAALDGAPAAAVVRLK